MKTTKGNHGRTKRLYEAALSARQSRRGEPVIRTSAMRASGAWSAPAKTVRTEDTMQKPTERGVQFASVSGESGAPFQEGWSVRVLSASCERDARRYEKML